ncbi:MAG: ribonuclease P protein component, partial [bacterium]
CKQNQRRFMCESLKRSEIVRTRRRICALLRTAQRVTGTTLTLRFLPQPPSNDSSIPPRRVAIYLSAKIKGSVIRNRLKRRLREIYRRNKSWFSPGVDYLFQVRHEATRLDFHELKEEVEKLARSAQITTFNLGENSNA